MIFSEYRKKLLSLWFDQKYAGYPWYLGKYLNEIDEELLRIRPPKFLKRTPRSLKERQHRKASEYRPFLFYYAPIILMKYLPPLYYHHFLLLVQAMLVYTSDYIAMKKLRAAEIEMAFFVKIFEKVYGLRFLTLNFHVLEHLGKCVRMFGPLWTITCFPFENANGWMVGLTIQLSTW